MYYIEKKIIAIITIITIVFTGFIFPNQVFTHSEPIFKFPNKIEYKIVYKKHIAQSKLEMSPYTSTNDRANKDSKCKYYMLLTMGNVKVSGYKTTDKWITYICKNNLSLYASYVINSSNNSRKEELRFIKAKSIGLLDDYVYVHKSHEKKSSETYTEIASPHKVIDLLSSFVVLSNKICIKNNSREQYNFFIAKTSYIVDCTVKSNVFYQHGDDKLPVDLVTLQYKFKHEESKKTKKTTSVDLAVFYIYNDPKTGYWFPVCIKLDDDKGNKLKFVASRWM